MKSLFLAAATAAVLAAFPVLAQSTTGQGTGSRIDSKFLDHVMQDGQAEVDLAQFASKKTQNAEVKALARRLAADHTTSNEQLMQIARKEGIQPAAGMSKAASQERAKLEKLDGQAFDQAFVKDVAQDHQKDIKYFEKQQSTLHDPQLKAFAQQTLAVLQEHLQMAQQVEGGSGSSSRQSTPTGPPRAR